MKNNNISLKKLNGWKKFKKDLKDKKLGKKRQEEEKKLREAEEESNKETPYIEEMELCDRLISYCQKLVPQELQAEKAPQQDKAEVLK